MEIKKFVPSPCPLVPEELNGKINFTSNCVLPDRDMELFNIVLEKLVEQMKEEEFVFSKVGKVTIIFTEKTDFELFFENTEMATYSKLIIYPVIHWQKCNIVEDVKIFSFAEELCHHFWRVDDELQVLYPTLRVMYKINNDDCFAIRIRELIDIGIEEPKNFAHF